MGRKSVSRERFARAIKQDRLANRDENPAAIFFYPSWGGNVEGKGGGWHGWIPCVPARTKDKRRRRRRLSFVSSVICLTVVVAVPPPFHPEPFPAARGRVRGEGGPAGGKDAGDMGLHG